MKLPVPETWETQVSLLVSQPEKKEGKKKEEEKKKKKKRRKVELKKRQDQEEEKGDIRTYKKCNKVRTLVDNHKQERKEIRNISGKEIIEIDEERKSKEPRIMWPNE